MWANYKQDRKLLCEYTIWKSMFRENLKGGVVHSHCFVRHFLTVRDRLVEEMVGRCRVHRVRLIGNVFVVSSEFTEKPSG